MKFTWSIARSIHLPLIYSFIYSPRWFSDLSFSGVTPVAPSQSLLLDSLGGLQSGLLFTISLPWIRPPANPRLQVRGISPLFNNNTNRCSPGHSQSSSALWDLPEPSPDHLVRPKPNHLLLLKTCFQSWLNVLQTPKPTF